MSDRRRINGPPGGTSPVVFERLTGATAKPRRTRADNELRRMFLKSGLIPAANGSAYLELEAPTTDTSTLSPTTSTIKLSCSVIGPKPLSRNASFSPNLQLTASVKFAPFATRNRRAHVRDNIERDLGSHLESALKGMIIPDRWPKSAIDVAVTVLEGEEDDLWTQGGKQDLGVSGVGLMNVLSGSITVAAAALIDAGIDCLDLLAGGVAAFTKEEGSDAKEVLDPRPSEHDEITSACVVAYLPSRDEITEIWCKGQLGISSDGTESFEKLVNAAIKSARGAHGILLDAMKESVSLIADHDASAPTAARAGRVTSSADVDMQTVA